MIVNLLNMILPMILNKMGMNETQRRKVQSSLAKAQNLIQKNRSNPINALKDAGVPKDFLQQLLNFTDLPMVKSAINQIGFTTDDVKSVANDIISNYDNTFNCSTTDNNLSMLKNGLKRLH